MLQKNQIYDAEIVDYTSEGQGIAKIEGCAVFIPNAIVGESCQVRIEKTGKTWAAGKMTLLTKRSPHRVNRACPHAKLCGGCDFWHMDYEEELRLKAERVRQALNRIGGEALENVEILGAPQQDCYRNKAQFPFGTDREGHAVTGFYAARSHRIIPCTDCLLGVEENQIVLEKVLAHMEKYQIPAYDETSGKGLVRHVLIRKGFATGELMVCLILNGRTMKALPALSRSLQEIPGMTSISVNVNQENTNVIMGRELLPIWGPMYITDRIGDISYRISPLSFYQVNPVQTRRLYETALEYADLKGSETVWDLYCGIGTISLFLAGKAGQVYGVEIVPEAIEDARENARLNGITNAEFFVGKAEEVLPRKYAEEGIHADVIIVDPPRKGCEESLLRTMMDMKPDRIVYVSCDSATLARDLKYLCGSGEYELVKWRAVDQFPMSVHVETAVLLTRKP